MSTLTQEKIDDLVKAQLSAAEIDIEQQQFEAVKKIGNSLIFHGDCMDWLKNIPANSIDGIVTDPPYGIKEYDLDQLKKRKEGKGGIWRIPPTFDGSNRSPLPRFTALNQKERNLITEFFKEWSKLVTIALKPGGHVFIATNAFLAPLLYEGLIAGGLEYRGEIIREVMTLRGGDRPKNAEKEFPDVCSLPRGCFEPWGLFRKPIEENMTVGECLRTYGTGALRRKPDGTQFCDVIPSERTPKNERTISDHPSLKPQSFLRQIVHAVLPLGKGIVLDPFMGSGSTIAAAEAMGLSSIGIERHDEYFDSAEQNIKILSKVEVIGYPPAPTLF